MSAVEHLLTLGTFGDSHLELGCCQICGAVVVIDGTEGEPRGPIGHREGTGLNLTLRAEDHLAWHAGVEDVTQ